MAGSMKRKIVQMQDQQTEQSTLGKIWKVVSTIFIFFLLLLTLLISSSEMFHGQMLRAGERLFGDPASKVQYSFLRGDPVKPACDPNANVDSLVEEKLAEDAGGEFAGLFDEPADKNAIRQSIIAAQTDCQQKHDFYTKVSDRITPQVKAFRTVETTILGLRNLGVNAKSIILMLILAFAAITTTLKLHHIAIRPPKTRKDFLVYSLSMVTANALLLFSTSMYLRSQLNLDVHVETGKIVFHGIWVGLFAVLLVISLVKLFSPPKTTEEGNFALAGLSVPLYASMGIIAGIAFIFFMDYSMGVGIYLGQMLEHANTFLSLALFIWIGMLLKQTKVVDYFLDLVRPFNFSPETLSIILMIAAGFLTAYTGASGIFVIAAGAIIYREVFNSGARRQYALAMTAMSGSLGVVLRPCLLIVVIAALNNKVTTDDLYGKGMYVFILSTSILYVISLSLADQKFKIRAPSQALPESANALKRVSPYIVIGLAVILFYSVGLQTKLDEFTAPMILPFVLLFILIYDKVIRNKAQTTATLETIMPYLAVPVLAYAVYVLFNKLADTSSIAISVGSFKINFVYLGIALLALVGYKLAINAFKSRSSQENNSLINRVEHPDLEPETKGLFRSIFNATHETIGHIGAIVMLMALTMSIGGLIEKAGLMSAMPETFGSTLLAIMIFTTILVFVGMIMEPFGAAILVNATIAPIAYQNGIDPVHFWIIVLAAFELGYLSPPVALNQLLARQVVGEKEIDEADAEVRHKSFYWRYERWILPFVVMLITLLIVAYVPYFFKLFGWYGG